MKSEKSVPELFSLDFGLGQYARQKEVPPEKSIL